MNDALKNAMLDHREAQGHSRFESALKLEELLEAYRGERLAEQLLDLGFASMDQAIKISQNF